MRVLADRTGADLTGLEAGGIPRQRAVAGGEEFPLRKVQAGGRLVPAPLPAVRRGVLAAQRR